MFWLRRGNTSPALFLFSVTYYGSIGLFGAAFCVVEDKKAKNGPEVNTFSQSKLEDSHRYRTLVSSDSIGVRGSRRYANLDAKMC